MKDLKDLFVLTADLDARVTMQAVLRRHHSLSIRPISFDVDRHPMRDAGVVGNGPELVRKFKGRYRKVLLLWDHHGSGWHKLSPEECVSKIQNRLDGVSWQGHSGAVVMVPELEEWLWHNEPSVCRRLGISSGDLQAWIEEFAVRQKLGVTEVKQSYPKELFEYVCLDKIGRTISPKDFEEIARHASLVDWQKSKSFKSVVSLLRAWFPVEGQQD